MNMSNPGSHQKGPLVSEQGFKVGTKASNTEVINSSGNLVKAGAVSAAASITDGVVTSTKLASEAGFENLLTFYSGAAIAVGKPVYISGRSTAGGLKVDMAQGNDRTKAAQFVAVTATTAANITMSVAPVATVAYNSTSAAGTLLYLGTTAAGVVQTTAPSGKANVCQAVGVVTVGSTSAGYAKMYPGYSKAVCQSS
jgi:hypothetical protein